MSRSENPCVSYICEVPITVVAYHGLLIVCYKPTRQNLVTTYKVQKDNCAVAYARMIEDRNLPRIHKYTFFYVTHARLLPLSLITHHVATHNGTCGPVWPIRTWIKEQTRQETTRTA